MHKFAPSLYKASHGSSFLTHRPAVAGDFFRFVHNPRLSTLESRYDQAYYTKSYLLPALSSPQSSSFILLSALLLLTIIAAIMGSQLPVGSYAVSYASLKAWIYDQEEYERRNGQPAPLTDEQRRALAVLVPQPPTAPQMAPQMATNISHTAPRITPPAASPTVPPPAPVSVPRQGDGFQPDTDFVSMLMRKKTQKSLQKFCKTAGSRENQNRIYPGPERRFHSSRVHRRTALSQHLWLAAMAHAMPTASRCSRSMVSGFE